MRMRKTPKNGIWWGKKKRRMLIGWSPASPHPRWPPMSNCFSTQWGKAIMAKSSLQPDATFCLRRACPPSERQWSFSPPLNLCISRSAHAVCFQWAFCVVSLLLRILLMRSERLNSFHHDACIPRASIFVPVINADKFGSLGRRGMPAICTQTVSCTRHGSILLGREFQSQDN